MTNTQHTEEVEYLTTNGYALCHRHAYEWVGVMGDGIIAAKGDAQSIADIIGIDSVECADCTDGAS